MKKIIRYNPSLCTANMGDFIIFDSIVNELDFLFNNAFNLDISTHLPITYSYTKLLMSIKADYKFVCGTNLLMGKLNGIFRQWDINILNAKHLGPVILIGVGWWQYNNKLNNYTKKIYQDILSKDYLHSVRDNYTKEMLEKNGFKNIINTACPTMWKLTEKHCNDITNHKAKNVITTLTDYHRNINEDTALLKILERNYENIYIWIQGSNDYEYLIELQNNLNINLNIINPNLRSYDNILEMDDIEYVGSRLHAGIRALQHKRRTLILAVDNRALEKKKDFNLPVIKRENISELEEIINSNFHTNIKIPTNEINIWKEQFRKS